MPSQSSAGPNDKRSSLAWIKGDRSYVLDEVDETVTSCLRSDETSSPVQALPCEHTDELVLQLLVGSKQETNLACTSPDITS